MNNLSFQTPKSSFQEWTNFMTDLNNKKSSTKSFLVKSDNANQIINNLEKELLKSEEKPTVKLVLMKRQLSIDFSMAA